MGRKVKQRRHRKLDLTKTNYKATSCEDSTVDASTLAEVKEANKEIMEKKSKKSRKYDNNKDLPAILEECAIVVCSMISKTVAAVHIIM